MALFYLIGSLAYIPSREKIKYRAYNSDGQNINLDKKLPIQDLMA